MTEETKNKVILKCPKCKRINTLVKHGFRGRVGQSKRQQWICKADKCFHTTCDPLKVKPQNRDSNGRFLAKEVGE